MINGDLFLAEILLDGGPLATRWGELGLLGLGASVALLCGLAACWWSGRRLGLQPSTIADACLVCLVFGLLGARAGPIALDPTRLAAAPAEVHGRLLAPVPQGAQLLVRVDGAERILAFAEEVASPDSLALAFADLSDVVRFVPGSGRNFTLATRTAGADVALAVLGDSRACRALGLDFPARGEEPRTARGLDRGLADLWGGPGGWLLPAGVLLGFLALGTYSLVRRLSFGALGDAVAPALLLALAIGFAAALPAGADEGTETDLPWAVAYGPASPVTARHAELGLLEPGSVRSRTVHPIAGYRALGCGLIFVCLCGLGRGRRLRLGLGLLLLAGLQCGLEPWTVDHAPVFRGLSYAQLAWGLVAGCGLLALLGGLWARK